MVVFLSLAVVYLTNRQVVDQHLSAIRLSLSVMLSGGRASRELVATDEPVMKMEADVPASTACESEVSVEVELKDYATQIYLQPGAQTTRLLDLKLAIMEAALLADPESDSLPTQWLAGDLDSMVVHCDGPKGGEALLTDANYPRFRASLRELRVSQSVVNAAPYNLWPIPNPNPDLDPIPNSEPAPNPNPNLDPNQVKAAPKKRVAPYVPRNPTVAPAAQHAKRPGQGAVPVSALDAALAARSAMLSDDLVMD